MISLLLISSSLLVLEFLELVVSDSVLVPVTDVLDKLVVEALVFRVVKVGRQVADDDAKEPYCRAGALGFYHPEPDHGSAHQAAEDVVAHFFYVLLMVLGLRLVLEIEYTRAQLEQKLQILVTHFFNSAAIQSIGLLFSYYA